jgi:hypothetical protein
VSVIHGQLGNSLECCYVVNDLSKAFPAHAAFLDEKCDEIFQSVEVTLELIQAGVYFP